MDFLNRTAELSRLDRLARHPEGGLVVVYGRRRVGKTRLLLEWSERHGGLYTVADQSTAEIQRQYFAEAVAQRLPGFADVAYRDWRGLLTRLARDAQAAEWRGPLIFDEFPYLVLASPELPSVVQRFIDHDASKARLVVALAGSSQRMMQGLVLASDAPLFGRAREMFDLQPLPPRYLREAFEAQSPIELLETWTAWGGVPRYWELAADLKGSVASRVDELVLDPLGPLHREPDRLLIEELPPALETRPVLEAIGAGAHRVSEIAGRVGRPATSMSRPLERLQGMGLVRREVPFGESEKKSRRSLYKIDDPFVHLWFRVVAPHRARLASSPREIRLALLERFWEGLAAQSFEDLCSLLLTTIDAATPLGELGPWSVGTRWWRGNAPEWDVVAESLDGKRLLLGEVKWRGRPFDEKPLGRAARETRTKPAPELGRRFREHEEVRVLFVPEVAPGAMEVAEGSGVQVLSVGELI